MPQVNVSQCSRMAVTGREVLRWLAQGHVLNATPRV
jgi:DNA-binding CsgD family transcriptional regulator